MDDQTRQWITETYPKLNHEQRILISMEAYDRGHSAGQEEVNAHAKALAFFADSIMRAAS